MRSNPSWQYTKAVANYYYSDPKVFLARIQVKTIIKLIIINCARLIIILSRGYHMVVIKCGQFRVSCKQLHALSMK